MLLPVIFWVGKENKLSIQISTIARSAVNHGYHSYIGGNKADWNQIHVADLVQGYLTILCHIESTARDKALDNQHCFIENGEGYARESCAEDIGKAFQNAGEVQDPATRKIPNDLRSYLFSE